MNVIRRNWPMLFGLGALGFWLYALTHHIRGDWPMAAQEFLIGTGMVVLGWQVRRDALRKDDPAELAEWRRSGGVMIGSGLFMYLLFVGTLAFLMTAVLVVLPTPAAAVEQCSLTGMSCIMPSGTRTDWTVHKGDAVTMRVAACGDAQAVFNWCAALHSTQANCINIAVDVGDPRAAHREVYKKPAPWNSSDTFSYVAEYDGELPWDDPFGGWSAILDQLPPSAEGCTAEIIRVDTGQPPAPPHRMSQATKDGWKKFNLTMTGVGGFTSLIAGRVAVSGNVEAAAVLSAVAGTAFLNAWIADLALYFDPYDPNYRVLYAPRLIPFPAGRLGINRPVYLRLVRTELKLYAYSYALYVAVNRANSAHQDGDQQAEDLQQGQIDSLLHAIGPIVTLDGQLRQRVAATFKTPTLTLDEITTRQAKGLPNRVGNSLAAMGFGAGKIRQARDAFAALTPEAIAAVEGIDDPVLIAEGTDLAALLAQ